MLSGPGGPFDLGQGTGSGPRPPHPTGCRTMDRMALASLLSDLGTAAGVTVVVGMAGLLVFRGTRKRVEDVDPDDR